MTTKPTYDLKKLMIRTGVPTAQVLAEISGLSRKAVHNRMSRGISWVEADELAVRCGLLPWEVWPEWADADPADWVPRVCAAHGNEFVIDLDDLTQECSVCGSMSVAA